MATEAGNLAEKARPKRLVAAICLVVAIAACTLVLVWSNQPAYGLLFGRLGEADKSQVVRTLESDGIPHRIEAATASVLVPADKVSEARMRLAAKGLPEAGGFSLLEKGDAFGLDPTVEDARYQLAIEKELSRTIAGLRQLDGALVQIVVPRLTTSLQDNRLLAASVFLRLKAGRQLTREQILAIVNLVASSIPGLVATRVTVIDNLGRLLSAPDRMVATSPVDQQLDISRRLEEDYVQRIVSLLAPLLGPDRVRAQVVAQVDTTVTEETREQYVPGSRVLRSEQVAQGSSRNGEGAAWSESTRDYEFNRSIAYTRNPGGRLRRLSVVVLVDYLRMASTSGGSTDVPLPAEQIERVKALVKDVVGFDAQRGDTVTVVNQRFQMLGPVVVPEKQSLRWYESALVRDAIRLIAGLVVASLVLFAVVRPLVRAFLGGGGFSLTRRAAMPDGAVSSEEPVVAATAAESYDQQINQARAHVARSPLLAAQVVSEWVRADRQETSKS